MSKFPGKNLNDKNRLKNIKYFNAEILVSYFFFLFSKTDINGLMDGGAYASEAGFWSDTPLCARASKQDMAAVFARGVRED